MSTQTWILPCLLLTLAAGCATTRYEEFGPPPEDVETPGGVPVETISGDQMLTAQVMGLAERLSDLELRLLERMDVLDASDSELAARLATVSEQLQELRRQLLASRSQSSLPSPTIYELPQKVDLNALYDRALQAFDAQEYTDARLMFNQILTQAPQGELADNAQYWVGECAYAVEDYSGGLDAFKRVFQFTETEKDDDAQIKLGYCYLKLGDSESALIEFKRLTVDYPQSEYLSRAEEQIRRIRAAKASRP